MPHQFSYSIRLGPDVAAGRCLFTKHGLKIDVAAQRDYTVFGWDQRSFVYLNLQFFFSTFIGQHTFRPFYKRCHLHKVMLKFSNIIHNIVILDICLQHNLHFRFDQSVKCTPVVISYKVWLVFGVVFDCFEQDNEAARYLKLTELPSNIDNVKFCDK